MDRVEDCISFLIGKAAQQVTRRAREKLAPWNVPSSRFTLLNCVCEATLSMSDLSCWNCASKSVRSVALLVAFRD